MAIRSNEDNYVNTSNVIVLILADLPVCVEVFKTSIAHANGILPVPRDKVVMLGTRPAYNSPTAPAVMSAIELKQGRKQNSCFRISFVLSFDPLLKRRLTLDPTNSTMT